MIRPVILCGGSGTRLWPISRRDRPKQLVKIFNGLSLFQKTLLRFNDSDVFADPIIVAADSCRFIAAQQAEELDINVEILIEPEPRDTFPAILAGVLWSERKDPEMPVIVSPSDHEIGAPDAFRNAVSIAAQAAMNADAVVLGIVPVRPETGFGYILPGQDGDGTTSSRRVEKFVEKPDKETAIQFVEQGYLWNGGYFCLRPGSLAEMTVAEKETFSIVESSLNEATIDLDFVRIGSAFRRARKVSFDVAVMENCKAAQVVPVEMQWSDMGDWNGFWAASEKDEDNNVLRGDVIAQDCKNSVIYSDSRLICAVGVEGLGIVETSDAILISDINRAQEVKMMVKKMEDSGREEATTPPRVHRPWGWYQTIDLGGRFQVKRISVNPGASLSLQKHFHRAEHWVGVSGTAEVTIGDRVELLRENQSVYIPMGEVHRLSNPGRIAAEIIEVQTGSYLGEDDIVRLEDTFGRA